MVRAGIHTTELHVRQKAKVLDKHWTKSSLRHLQLYRVAGSWSRPLHPEKAAHSSPSAQLLIILYLKSTDSWLGRS